MSVLEANGRLVHYRLDRFVEHAVESYVRLLGVAGPLRGASVEVAHPACFVREASDGYYVIATSGPRLSGTAVDLSVRAAGHRELVATVVLDRDAPDRGDVALAPNPIRVHGSVMRVDGGAPAALELFVEPVAVGDGFPTPLRTTLTGSYPAGTAVAVRTFAVSATAELARAASAGARSLRASVPSQWAPGVAARYGVEAQRAFVRVSSAHVTGSAVVRLSDPVVRTTPTRVELLAPSGAPLARTLLRACRPGDGVVWLNAPTTSGVLELGTELAEVGLLPLDARSFALEGLPAPAVLRARDASGSESRALVADFTESERPLAMILD